MQIFGLALHMKITRLQSICFSKVLSQPYLEHLLFLNLPKYHTQESSQCPNTQLNILCSHSDDWTPFFIKLMYYPKLENMHRIYDTLLFNLDTNMLQSNQKHGAQDMASDHAITTAVPISYICTKVNAQLQRCKRRISISDRLQFESYTCTSLHHQD